MTLHCTSWEIKNNHRSQKGSEGSLLPATARHLSYEAFPAAHTGLYLELIQKAVECKFKEGWTYSQYSLTTRLRSPETWSGPEQTEIKSLKFTDEVVCITYNYYCRKLVLYKQKMHFFFSNQKLCNAPDIRPC